MLILHPVLNSFIHIAPVEFSQTLTYYSQVVKCDEEKSSRGILASLIDSIDFNETKRWPYEDYFFYILRHHNEAK